MNFHSFKWKLSYKTIKDCNKFVLVFLICTNIKCYLENNLSSYLWPGDGSQHPHSQVQARVRAGTFHFLFGFGKIGQIMSLGCFLVLLYCFVVFDSVFGVPLLALHYGLLMDQLAPIVGVWNFKRHYEYRANQKYFILRKHKTLYMISLKLLCYIPCRTTLSSITIIRKLFKVFVNWSSRLIIIIFIPWVECWFYMVIILFCSSFVSNFVIKGLFFVIK